MGPAFFDVLVGLVLAAVVFTIASLASAWALLKGLTSRWVVLCGTLGALLFLAGYFFLAEYGGPDFFAQAQKAFDQVWNAQLPALLKEGSTQETLDLAKVYVLKYFLWSFPAWVAVGCLAAGLVSYYLTSAILRRVTTKVGNPLAFRFWILPEPLVFGFLGACLLKLFTPENSAWDILGDNLLVFFVGLYALGGLSIVSFFFSKWRLSVFWRMVNYLLIIQFAPETVAVVSCLGLLDVWFDLRKLKPALGGEAP